MKEKKSGGPPRALQTSTRHQRRQKRILKKKTWGVRATVVGHLGSNTLRKPVKDGSVHQRGLVREFCANPGSQGREKKTKKEKGKPKALISLPQLSHQRKKQEKKNRQHNTTPRKTRPRGGKTWTTGGKDLESGRVTARAPTRHTFVGPSVKKSVGGGPFPMTAYSVQAPGDKRSSRTHLSPKKFQKRGKPPRWGRMRRRAPRRPVFVGVPHPSPNQKSPKNVRVAWKQFFKKRREKS